MSFDVKEEANDFSCAYGVKREAVEALLARAVRETEEADIKAVCSWCGEGKKPELTLNTSDGVKWAHGDKGLPTYCHAHPIHERRRRRKQG